MKLFFEEYRYKKEILDQYLGGHYYQVDKDKAFTNYVGYFFYNDSKHPDKSDSVFILPKVFVNYDDKNNVKAFDKYNPEDIIDFENFKEQEENNSDKGLKQLVYELSVWLFRAINIYKEDNRVTRIIEDAQMPDVISNKGKETETLLEIILQLLRFNKENRNLLTYISRINNSGNNKIHWGKTISKINPIISNNQPVYLEFKTKQKAIDLDEELIILFYSTLVYIRQTFHFHLTMDVQYKLIPANTIKSMIETGKGTRLLKNIRRKYFTDKLVKLWKLLYVFYDKSERIATGRYHEETLLAKNFERIFEDMVDYLISDEDCPENLRNQDDGKAVDHIFSDKSLIYNTNNEDNRIYYVGDSKYYKKDLIGLYSVAKQYTYARNIIQKNIEIINLRDTPQSPKEDNKSNKGYFKYRDEITEGYNITPNFFIFGRVEKEPDTGYYNYTKDLLNTEPTDTPTRQDGKTKGKNVNENFWKYQRQFENRLFDRDTLLLQKYDLNFLFVLTTYAANQNSVRTLFRNKIRNRVRKDLTDILNSSYAFYKVILLNENGTEKGNTEDNIKEFVDNNFKILIGKVFAYKDNPDSDTMNLIFAIEGLTKDLKTIPIPENSNKKIIGNHILRSFNLPIEE